MKKKTLRSGLLATTTLLSSFAIPALVVGVATLAPTAADAQDFTNGSLSGTVKTSAGAPAAGAAVSIVGKTNSYKGTATTDAAGHFEFHQIPLGNYDVTITSKDGGKATESVQVALGTVTSYDFTVAATTSEVVVRGKARRNLDFNRTTTGQVINVQEMIDKVPVGRSLEGLADLVPGISINGVFGFSSIGGASPAENVYYVDGMNVTNFRNFLGGSNVPFDFYDQLEVKTGGYDAEYGRNTGGAFIGTTRSGSDNFHGGVSVSYAPDKMAQKSHTYAVDLNTNSTGYNKRGTHEEETYWLSGPIWKNHIYFFGLYNPRSFTDYSYQTDATTGAVDSKTVSTTKDDPFYGGKLTLMLNPQHRLDVTYFKDSEVPNTDTTYTDGSPEQLALSGQGGITRIYKYTGKFTDWFSLTALAGYSSFNQTSSSALDNTPAVFENGQVVRGNPNLLVEQGSDIRKNYRIDGNFYYNFFGRHHTVVGGDLELLTAVDFQKYSGGIYYRYYPAGTNCGSTGTVTNNCVRVRSLFNGGSFGVHNRAYYIQDDWTITDRLNLNLGLRSDTFDNRDASGQSFLKNTNKISPRVGVSYDVFGDKTTQLTGFYGRYYLPIAANTNIREAGGETFLQDYYIWTSRDSSTLVPVLGTHLKSEVLSDGSVPTPGTLASHNLSAQYEDEFSLGLQKRLDNGWKVAVRATYRKLSDVMEDTNLRYAKQSVCAYLSIPNANCGGNPPGINFGSSGYVLVNPGNDVIVTLGDSFGPSWAGKVVTIPNSVLGLPTAKRTYSALEFDWERPDDGKWYLQGSLVLSKSIGNIEGGVKSDNGQSDTGLTQDFDENGWTDGSYGLLPNHHGFSFKTYGQYHFDDKFSVSFNAAVLSPRHYGCIGYYPLNDGRADSSTATAWYCNSKLTPRASQFKGDWTRKLDLSFIYKQTMPVGTLRYSMDIFNVLGLQDATNFGEFGESGGVNTPNLNYKKVTAYQTPRYVRLGLKYQF